MGNIEKFDAIADRYDTAERAAVAAEIARAIREQVGDGAGKAAIDYGCGTGLVGLVLLDVFRSVLFVDASSSMVEQVGCKLECMGASNAATLCCDLMSENPPELQADYVILAQTLLHIKETDAILVRLYRVLGNGGHLLIVDFDRNDAVASEQIHNGFDQQALRDMLLDIGFAEAQSRTFYHGDRLLMNRPASLFILDAVK